MRRYKRIRKYPQLYDPGSGAARECKNDAVVSIVYMVKYGYLNSNIDMNDILPLMAE